MEDAKQYYVDLEKTQGADILSLMEKTRDAVERNKVRPKPVLHMRDPQR